MGLEAGNHCFFSLSYFLSGPGEAQPAVLRHRMVRSRRVLDFLTP
jgi:hypothetical protein